MLLDYAEALKATLPPSQLQTSAKASKFARPPLNHPPPLVNISYKQAATNEAATNTSQKNNNTPKKRCTQDANSTTTEATTDLTKFNPTATALADLKQDILNTMRQDLAKLTQCKIKPLKQEIHNLNTNNQTLTSTMVQLQQQMAAFSTQMATYMQQIPKPPPAQPHSASSRGGAC